MARGGQALARVAVIVRAGAAPLWWLGLTAAAAGALLPGLTGRRIGLLSGAALFLVTAAAVATVRRGRHTRLIAGATRAARADFLQDRAVTVRLWRRSRRWWLLGAFLAALASSFALPGAGGLWLAGAGAGLWLRAGWLGRLERTEETLWWVPVDRLGAGPAGRTPRRTRATANGAAANGAGSAENGPREHRPTGHRPMGPRPVGPGSAGYRSTGIAAGDAAPGGARRR
ncbi:hypothetical protein [Streptomyces sp. NPDC015131]|uniref:hypothetical protein n=1 Tax=Streptomyces sp. NPDC015131 TaxID=3364941 RepID=UPI0036F62D5D